MKRVLFLLLAVAVLAFVGCSSDNGTGPNQTLTNLVIQLSNMTPHVGQLTEFRVLSSNNVLQARGILKNLPSANVAVSFPKLLESATYRLDFYCDMNQSGVYDAPPADHAWRVTIPSDGIVTFTHNTNFTDISSPAYTVPGNEFKINFTGMTPHVGQLLQLRVIEKPSGRTVGYYHLSTVPGAVFSISIPDMIKSGTEYQVDFYADMNGSGGYNAPPTDHAWRLTGTGTASGLTLDFAHNTNFTDIGF